MLRTNRYANTRIQASQETAGGILPKRVWRQTLLDTRLCDEWLDKTVGDTYHEPPWL